MSPEMDTGAGTVAESQEPPAHDFDRIKSMVLRGKELVEQGVEAGTSEFNRLGGLDWHGFRAWRERHAEGIDAEELDAVHAHAPIDAGVESDEAREARQAEEEKPAVLDDGSPGPGAVADPTPASSDGGSSSDGATPPASQSAQESPAGAEAAAPTATV